MNTDFRNFVSITLRSNIEPYKRLQGDKAGDPLGGKTPPQTPEEFRKQLTDRVEVSALNDWDLDKLEAEGLVELACNKYVQYYAGWVNGPLQGDAPQVVRDWQAAARAAV
jgi:hypothetical protein